MMQSRHVKYFLAISLGSLGFLVSLCFLAVFVFLWWRTPNILPPQPPETFLLSEVDFPALWETDHLSVYRASEMYNFAGDAAIQTFTHPHQDVYSDTMVVGRHGVASFVAYRFVKDEFAYQNEHYFEKYPRLTEWDIPPVLANLDLHADESRIGCAVISNYYNGEQRQCVFIARYGQYFSEFWVLPDVTGLTDSQFRALIERIDRQFWKVLKIE